MGSMNLRRMGSPEERRGGRVRVGLKNALVERLDVGGRLLERLRDVRALDAHRDGRELEAEGLETGALARGLDAVFGLERGDVDAFALRARARLEDRKRDAD